MNQYYTGKGSMGAERRTVMLPSPKRDRLLLPENYLADEGLVDACNVALMLGQPLLLTGEPGTGKTQLAYSLAWELGLDDPLKFETKSTSTAKDLFYTFDALRRFHDAHSGNADVNSADYLAYNALGTAILRTKTLSEIQELATPNFVHTGKCRSVVLIDEIDKAPRDFPNDILNELELLYFRIPELNNQIVKADSDLQPIVVCTSNSEKDLPDAFMRRCVYYHVPFPKADRLREILTLRLGDSVIANDFLSDAIHLFLRLREREVGLQKPPSTAELMGWILTLQQLGGDAENPLTDPETRLRSLSSLIKNQEDQKLAVKVAKAWTNR